MDEQYREPVWLRMADLDGLESEGAQYIRARGRSLPPSDPCLRCGRCAGCHASEGNCPVPNTSCPIGRCPSGTWLNGYQFALRNLDSEAVQADLARIRAESGVMTQASDLSTSEPPTGRESGGTCPPRTHWCDR